MKKPCSTCDSIIVVNGKSLPNPQCHLCRKKSRQRICKHCQAVIRPRKATIKPIFCSKNCYNQSRDLYRTTTKSFTSSRNVYRAKRFGCEYESVNRICVFERDGYICHLCGTKTDPSSPTNSAHYPSLDHIIPMSKHGGHLYSNIATACFRCNILKSDLDLDTALLMLR